MFLVAAALIFVAPLDPLPAARHERAFQPRFEQAAADETPKSIWRTETSSGTGTHLQSTLTCPLTIAGFGRSRLLPFDNFGFDVGCNFDNPDIGRVTLYLTRRRGEDLSKHFTDAQSALKVNMTDAKPVPGDVPMPTAGLTFTGALYVRDDGTRTGVWVADVSGWTLKFRATYGARREEDVLAAMSQLTSQTLATAGTHLAACAAAPAVQRTGTPITDEDKIMSLSLVVALLEAELDEGKERGQPVAEKWCAEEAAGDQEAPLLFWRNIANTGDAGAMDRMSLMTIGEPPMLVSVANHSASLLSGELENKDEPLVHQLASKEGDTTHVFGFYSGRPSAATLTPLSKDAMLGKKNPVTSYNAKTNTITIPSGGGKPGT